MLAWASSPIVVIPYWFSFRVVADQVESFGLDECWLDVTGSVGLFGEGPAIANDIRGRIRQELGLTVSIGVSFNKVFAKLGSDMKKPDATTVITPENYRDKAWRLPVSDLLYVGPATTRKLNQYGITTIGELAQANMDPRPGRKTPPGRCNWYRCP